MLSPRTFAIALSLAAHASVVALAAASPPRGAPAQIKSDQAIEVALYSALAEDEPVISSAPHAVPEPAIVRAPRPLAQAKPTRALALGSPSVTESSAPANIEAASSTAEVAPLRFSLGAIPSHAVTAPSNGAQAVGIELAASESFARPLSEAEVTTRARLLAGPAPTYTAAAQAAGIEAELPFEIVVDVSGKVQSARALAHVGYGLDEAAARALRDYRFSAAQRGRQPVTVRMRWLVRFQLR